MSTRSAVAVSTLATHSAVSVSPGCRGALKACTAVGARGGAGPLTNPGGRRRSRCVALTKCWPAVSTLASGPPPAGA